MRTINRMISIIITINNENMAGEGGTADHVDVLGLKNKCYGGKRDYDYDWWSEDVDEMNETFLDKWVGWQWKSHWNSSYFLFWRLGTQKHCKRKPECHHVLTHAWFLYSFKAVQTFHNICKWYFPNCLIVFVITQTDNCWDHEYAAKWHIWNWWWDQKVTYQMHNLWFSWCKIILCYAKS